MKIHPAKSIFVKLLGAYIIAFLLISLGVIFIQILSASSPNTEISIRNIKYFASNLTEKIGIPPDINIAQNIADNTGLQIKIIGPDLKWSSEFEFQKMDILTSDDQDSDWHFFPWAKDHSITIQRGNLTYIFSDFHADYHITILIWIIMAISILAALSISFLIVRHLLKPLRIMNHVALEFGVSDWKKRVSPRGDDELATLGRAMDGMADRIENYIHSIQDLLVAVSHELRSPLTRMKVSLEFISNRRIRESMDEEINTLDRLTGDLLEQKRLSTQPNILNMGKINLQNWITAICKSYQRKGIPLTYNFEGPELTVPLDRSRMDLALRNLIENSRLHAPDSSIRISLDTTYTRGFTLKVSDNGPGMDKSLINRVGEPFLLGDSSRSGKRTGGGFGLGLSIVKAVAEAHGAGFLVRNLETGGFAVILQFRE